RSAAETSTEAHADLRLLYARVGTPYCPDHGLPLEAQSVGEMVDQILSWPEGTRLSVLAPLARGRKGNFEQERRDLLAQGFVRMRIDGDMVNLDDFPALNKNEKHDADVVVDRLRNRPDSRQRLAESFETALELAQGRALAHNLDTDEEQVFSLYHACPVFRTSLIELEPRLFSFNNPAGACPTCNGLGTVDVFDPNRVVPFPDLSLAGGAVYGWDRRNAFTANLLTSLARHYGFDIETPFESLP